MHFVDMDMYDYKVFKSLTQPLLCDYVTAFRDRKLPVLVQEAFRRLLSTSLVVKNIYFHATRAQEVDSTNWKEIKNQRKCLSTVAGPENKQTAISYIFSDNKRSPHLRHMTHQYLNLDFEEYMFYMKPLKERMRRPF